KIGRGIKEMAKELDLPMIHLTQIPKSKLSTDAPTIDDARDSGSITEAADFVFGLWQDENINDLQKQYKFINLTITKNRKGQLGSVILQMNLRNLRVVELSNEE